MATLAASAIVSIKEYKDLIGMDTTNDANDEQLTMHINAASAMIHRYIGRTLCPVTQAVEVFDGTGEKSYYAVNFPIATVTDTHPTPVLKYWNGTSWTTHSGSFTYHTVTGRFYFTDGNIFASNPDYWQLTYWYGYERPDVPVDIKIACSQLVFRTLAKLSDGKEGLTSQAFDGATTSYDLNKIPPDIRHTLDLVRGKIYG